MLDPVVFTLAVLFVLGTPGPTNTLLATGGATVGFRRALPLLIGEAFGYIVSILTIGLLLGPVITSSPKLAVALRCAVGLYLVYLATKLWRQGGASFVVTKTVSPGQVFLTTLLNPKAIIFALGVIPFQAGTTVWPPYMLGFMALLALVACGWISLGSALGQAAGRFGWGGIIPRVGAVAIASFAVLLLSSPLLQVVAR